MNYATVCSGIEAPSVGWKELGWTPVFFAEIKPFPCALLTHHYPDVPNLGDMTEIDGEAWRGKIDLLAGGTPCQSFSVAGLRKSLGDDRGNLTLKFVELYHATGAVWGLWENVPGVLNTHDNAFGCLLAGLVGEASAIVPHGGRWTNAGVVDGPLATAAWRVLDAQYFGVAQRRRRVFVVVRRAGERGHPGAVLFEPEGVRRDSPPRREAGKGVAGTLGGSSQSGGFRTTDLDNSGAFIPVAYGGNNTQGPINVATAVNASHTASGRQDFETFITHSLRAEGFDASEYGTGRGTPLVPVSIHTRQDPITADDVAMPIEAVTPVNAVVTPILEAGKRCGTKGDKRDGLGIGQPGDPMFTLQSGAQHAVAAEYYSHDYCQDRVYSAEGLSPALNTAQDHKVRQGMAVRRLTPRECGRLQGFPDDYTLVPYRNKPAEQCPDGPRYKALGNSWAVPCGRWIAERIQTVMEACA